MSQEISEQQITEAINRLNKSSSSGPDGSSPRLIQELFRVIPSMSYASVRKELGEAGYQYTTSSNVKMPNIIFIPKKTNKKCIKKLRPISLLSTFYKIISNILSTQLRGATLSNNLIPQEMLAYLPARSGQEAVRLVLDTIDNARLIKITYFFYKPM